MLHRVAFDLDPARRDGHLYVSVHLPRQGLWGRLRAALACALGRALEAPEEVAP